jgi:polyprenyl P-hydroxybenzoate/phenylacrylic acid decarboxylase-like protein
MSTERVRPVRLIVGMTGGPGAAFGVHLLEMLREGGVETHLVVSSDAEPSISEQTGRDPEDVRGLATHVYDSDNMAARISSGSFLTRGMIVAPCSFESLAAIATGMASDLINRAADVTIKEARPLALLLGEAPWTPRHFEHLGRLSTIRSVVLPPVRAFSLDTDPRAVEMTVRALLDGLGIDRPASSSDAAPQRAMKAVLR